MGQQATDSIVSTGDTRVTSAVWHVHLAPAAGRADRRAAALAAEAADLHLATDLQVSTARGFLLQGELAESDLQQIAGSLLAEPVVEIARVECVSGDHPDPACRSDEPVAGPDGEVVVYVLPKPGVTDPEAETALRQLRSLGFGVQALRTVRSWRLRGLTADQVTRLATRLLGNDAIEQVIYNHLVIPTLQSDQTCPFELNTIPLAAADDAALQAISRDGGLSLTLVEMQTIQQHFLALQREPTEIELETIAQTWSEHCSHKTLAGRIEYRDEAGVHRFDNMLRETIFAATESIRAELGSQDWCVSVFRDNAGIVEFDEDTCLTFKVETHNRPSAIEPYGGANTGIGGVIRDTLGTGLGARPVCNTDVFCFAPPETGPEELPPGVLHPRRIMKSVVAGVRDYGNRMGIPTVNGAVCFDWRYVGNPLVFCGNVGTIPRDKSFKEPQPGDLIVSVGGRTGRDGIHGATFSSAELTEHSEQTSGGAVQIGNAITEKMVADVLLQARDEGLYTAVTDCGAGGFSSAIGEMGEQIGAVVWLERAPLKYQGLSHTEIWISEAQERMVFAVPEANWKRFDELCRSESVEATVVGQFEDTGELHLVYQGHTVGRLQMQFLHDGRPPVVRQAVWNPPPQPAAPLAFPESVDTGQTLRQILACGNVASKHWIIRQYDHEVLGGSVIKPLVGVASDGPSDAAVLRPKLDSRRGIAIACGLNPGYGDQDPGRMAASAIDEAVRNCVAVGADPQRIAILDNFCWGYTDRPETLGTLVRAAMACHDLAVQLGTPFISGKDSLNNEFSYSDGSGQRQTISIPATLLISALGQVDDVSRCVTMDLKSAGNPLYLVGRTRGEMGGSHFGLVHNWIGGEVPGVDGAEARKVFSGMHAAIQAGTVRACHDPSEGGLAVALAEMAFAGGRGAAVDLESVVLESCDPQDHRGGDLFRLFCESNTRFVCEVDREREAGFLACFSGLPVVRLGEVTEQPRLVCRGSSGLLLDEPVEELKQVWQAPLDWQ